MNVTNNIGTQISNANASNIRLSTPSFCNKTISPTGQNVTQISTQIHSPLSTVHTRPQASTLPKNSLKMQQPKMEQTRLKQMQNQRQIQNDKRLQGNNMQRLSNIASHSMQTPLNNPTRQQTTTNSIQQKQMSSSLQLQFQKQTTTQKSQFEQSSLSSPSENVHNAMNVEPLESSSICEKGPTNQQSFSSQTDSENNLSESVAFLEKIIHNPTNTKVQHQIQGNTAKMLVKLSNGEQRLITFDIPHEDCTVQDLLEQVFR